MLTSTIFATHRHRLSRINRSVIEAQYSSRLLCNQEKSSKKDFCFALRRPLWRDHEYFLRAAQPLNAKVGYGKWRTLASNANYPKSFAWWASVVWPSRRDQ